MKKMFKTAAVLAALLAMTNFIACSSGDDDNNEPSSGTESSTTGGGSSGSGSGDSGSTTTATSKTYNFVGLAFTDFPASSLTAKTDGTTVLTELGDVTQPYIAVNKTGWSVADATVIINNSKKVSARFTDSKTTALNIGNSNMASATALDTSSYNGIKITAPAAGTVTVTYKITAATAENKTGAADTTFAVFQNNAVVNSKTYDTTYATYSALDADAKTANYSNQTVSATVAAGDVYIGYFRGTGANTGNADVMSIVYEPATAE